MELGFNQPNLLIGVLLSDSVTLGKKFTQSWLKIPRKSMYSFLFTIKIECSAKCSLFLPTLVRYKICFSLNKALQGPRNSLPRSVWISYIYGTLL